MDVSSVRTPSPTPAPAPRSQAPARKPAAAPSKTPAPTKDRTSISAAAQEKPTAKTSTPNFSAWANGSANGAAGGATVGNAAASSSATPTPRGGSTTAADSVEGASASSGGATAQAKVNGNGAAASVAVAPNANGVSAAAAGDVQLGPVRATGAATASVEGPRTGTDVSASVSPDGTLNASRKDERVLASGDFQGSFSVQGPAGLSANGSAGGNFKVGSTSEINASYKPLPNGGFDMTLGGKMQLGDAGHVMTGVGIPGARAEGQFQTTVDGLPGGSSLDVAGHGFAGAGTRLGLTTFSNPATPPTPGQVPAAAGPGRIYAPNDGSGFDVNLQLGGFTGLEAQGTASGNLKTAHGSFGSTTQLRQDLGYGGDLGGQMTVNDKKLAFGAGGGSNVNRQTLTVSSPNGSSKSDTLAFGGYGEARGGFSRDNETGKTSMGYLVSLPTPWKGVTLGVGKNYTLDDRDVRKYGNLIPGAGDAAVQGLNALPGAVNQARQVPAQAARAGTEAVTSAGQTVEAGGNALSGSGRANLLEGVQRQGMLGTLQAAGGCFQMACGEQVARAGDALEGVGTKGQELVKMLTPFWMK